MKQYVKPKCVFTALVYEDVMIFSADPESTVNVGGLWGDDFSKKIDVGSTWE